MKKLIVCLVVLVCTFTTVLADTGSGFSWLRLKKICFTPTTTVDLEDNCTIPSASTIQPVSSTANVMTDDDEVIAPGTTNGQILVVLNGGEYDITLQSGGNAVLGNTTTLKTLETITFMWFSDISLWVKLW